MKALIFVFVLCFFDGLQLRAEAASPGDEAVQSNADIPEGYEIGEKSLSPNGRFADFISNSGGRRQRGAATESPGLSQPGTQS